MSQESNFSFTTKVNGDLLTVRGDSIEEFTFNAGELASSLQAITELQEAARAVMGVTQAEAVANVQAAVPGATVTQPAAAEQPQQGPETLADRWGNQWTYGAPGAPDLPDGRGKYALKQGTSKAGNQYKAWMDPASGPKPFPKGSVEVKPIWVK